MLHKIFIYLITIFIIAFGPLLTGRARSLPNQRREARPFRTRRTASRRWSIIVIGREQIFERSCKTVCLEAIISNHFMA